MKKLQQNQIIGVMSDIDQKHKHKWLYQISINEY